MQAGQGDLAPAQALLLAAAAAGAGFAVQVNDGQFHPLALGLLTVVLVAALAAASSRRAARSHITGAALVAFLGVALLIQLAELGRRPIAFDLRVAPEQASPVYVALAAALILGAAITFRVRLLARWHVPLLLAVHFALGVWVIRHAHPGIDVFVFQHNALNALARGTNPYTITFPNIYHPDTSFYGPGLVADGKLQFGFPYPPSSLFFVLPARLLAGDLRYAYLASLTAAGAFLAYARPGRVAALAAAVMLFSPRAFFVLQMSWTEPLLVMLLAAALFAAVRAPRVLPIALGVLLASKQYLALMVPAVWLLVDEGPRRLRRALALLAKAGAVVLVLTLPLALWAPRAFFRSVVALQFDQPFRSDALSYLALWARSVGGKPPSAVAFLAAAGAMVLSLRRFPATPAGCGAAVGVTSLAFFSFNKQAFCNYYFFAIGALCAAVSVVKLREA